jgi:4-hydroxybenzoate polyprenyltransferase
MKGQWNMTTLRLLLQSVRPQQWIKNLFILIPLPFGQKLFHYPSLLQGIQAVAIFCMMTGGVYLINDVLDLESDRKHPLKRLRPLARGLISPTLAKIAAAVLLLLSFIWGALCGKAFFLILLIYVAIQLLYSLKLKEIVIIDIFCITAGFFLRIVAGCVAIQVEISHWLIICAVLLSMFLALGKRRHELVYIEESNGEVHRKVLSEYSRYFLDQMIGIVSATSLLSYALYCISTETILKFQTEHMIYTLPFVIFGIFRYLYLIHQRNGGGSPEKVFISDWPLLSSVVMWGFTCVLIIYRII